MSGGAWQPDRYLRFAAERARPCEDLVRRVALEAPRRVVDLGCGTGASTAVLFRRWPGADVTGIDSDAAMLARAEKDHPGRAWERGDIATWPPGAPVARFDLVLSNAALHWVPDHPRLVPRLFAQVAPGGALACSVPDNLDGPAHRLMREVASRDAWRRTFTREVREWHVHRPREYYDLLAGPSVRVDVWSTEYVHILGSARAVVEWYESTGLRPFLDALPGAAERSAFLRDYEAAVAGATELAPARDGQVLLPFRRLFVVAYRD